MKQGLNCMLSLKWSIAHDSFNISSARPMLIVVAVLSRTAGGRKVIN